MVVKLLKNWLAEKRKQKVIREFCVVRRFELNGGYGFCVGGLIVRDFNYLLNFISDGNHASFEYFQALYDDHHLLKWKISKECGMATPTESERLGVAPATAKSNMQNLGMILTAIVDYVEFAQTHDFPVNPLRV